MKFTLNGQDKTVTDFPSVVDGRHNNGDVIPIYVDPADPTHWTNRQTPAPLAHELTGLLFILPAVLICALLGIIRALRLRQIAQGGNTGAAQILYRGTALWPPAHTLPAAPGKMSDRQIYSVFVPRHLNPKTGDTIQSPRRRNRAWQF